MADVAKTQVTGRIEVKTYYPQPYDEVAGVGRR
jgi:hypothetical protein